MAAEVEVDTEALAAQLNAWIRVAPKDASRTMVSFGNLLVAEIRNKVPYLTGTLSRSVEYQPADDGGEVGMGEGVPYAAWIEYAAWGGQGAHKPDGRFVYPTVQSEQARISEEYGVALQASIDKYPWSTA